jgi:hypothetical protein
LPCCIYLIDPLYEVVADVISLNINGHWSCWLILNSI